MKILLALASLIFATSTFAAPVAPLPGAKVFFVSPKDGETVTAKFMVKFKVEGMKLVKATDQTPGTGHHHLIIDAPATPQGEVVPKDATHIHLGNAQTETEVNLTPGKHTLTLQFADGMHMSYGPAMSQTITVNVK